MFRLSPDESCTMCIGDSTQCVQQIRTVGQHNNLTAKLLNVLKTVETQLEAATLQRHNNIATLFGWWGNTDGCLKGSQLQAT
jgi:hypothetical protein